MNRMSVPCLSARFRVVVLGALLGCMLGAVGCSKDAGTLPSNLPPVTYLSVIGSDLDTLSYRQVLHWWGTDPDGEIAGYLIKWDGGWTPPEDAKRWDLDPSWIVTTATTDTFLLATDSLADSALTPVFAARTFSVRALDDDNASDPVGRTQRFNVINYPPVVEWSPALSLPRISLPAVSFAWHPTDLDGFSTVRQFRYWLTRDQAAAPDTIVTGDTLVALGPTDFGAPGEPVPGNYTLHVVAVDESRTRSREITHTWSVVLPDGDYLLIDNVSSRVPGGNATEDPFFRSVMDSVTAGDYHVLDIETQGGFRTDLEVFPFLSLFKGIVWYGGTQNELNDQAVAANLKVACRKDGLLHYLEAGGRLLLCANNAVGDSSGLPRSFTREILGISDYYRMQDTTSQDPLYINTNIDLPNHSDLRAYFTEPADSVVQTSSTILNADFMLLESDITPLFSVRPGFISAAYPGSQGYVLTPDQSETPAYLGALSERRGRMAVLSFLLSRANGLPNRNRAGAALFRRVLLD